jgi:hypothetical protein
LTRLSIDFGAAATKAAVSADGDGSSVLVEFGPHCELPTALYFSVDGRIHAGNQALAFADRDDRGLVMGIKHLINAPGPVEPARRTLRVGGREFSLVMAVAALFGEVIMAVEHLGVGRLSAVTLTHPVGWGQDELDVLIQALQLAGVSAGPRFVSEPEGTAGFALDRGLVVADGQVLAVFDLGASTFDAAVIRALEGAPPDSPPSTWRAVGGSDLDAALLDLVHRQLQREDPAAADRYAMDRDERGWLFSREARRVKEALTEGETATFAGIGTVGDVEVSRAHFEETIAEQVDLCFDAFDALLDAAPEGRKVATIVASGGAVLVPLIEDRLQAVAARRGATFVLAQSRGISPGQVVAPGALAVGRRRGQVGASLAMTGAGDMTLPPRSRLALARPLDNGSVAVIVTPESSSQRFMVIDSQSARYSEGNTYGAFSEVSAIASDPDSGRFVTGMRNGSVEVWMPKRSNWAWRQLEQRPVERWFGSLFGKSVVAVALRGRWVAYMAENSGGAIFHLPTSGNTPSRTLPCVQGVAAMDFVDEPVRLVVVDPDRLLVFDATGSPPLTSLLPGLPTQVAFAPAWQLVAVRTESTLGLYEIRSDRARLCFQSGDGGSGPVAIVETTRGPLVVSATANRLGFTDLDGFALPSPPAEGPAPDQLFVFASPGLLGARTGSSVGKFVVEAQ